MTNKLIGFEYPKEEVVGVIEHGKYSDGQVRIAYMGAFLSRDEAEIYRDEFFSQYEQAIKDDFLVIIQDDLIFINAHWVVRIMAENAQGELELE